MWGRQSADRDLCRRDRRPRRSAEENRGNIVGEGLCTLPNNSKSVDKRRRQRYTETREDLLGGMCVFCRNCGTDLGGGTKFCPECGVASGEVPGVAPTTPQQPMCQPPLDPGSMASANAQALRQHELQIPDDLLRHFSMKQEQYDQYDAVTRNIVDLQRLKAAAMLAWGIVIASICAPGLLMCVGGVVLDHEFGLITPGVVMLILVIVSVIFIISFASINKKRCKTRDEYLERYHQLAQVFI